MSDKVVLEIPAASSHLPVVRMVVGGMAARADLTISEIDELHLAMEEVLRAAEHLESTPRYRFEIEANRGEVRILAGPFGSPHLLDRLRNPCCDLILRVVKHDVQSDTPNSHSVIVTKTRRG